MKLKSSKLYFKECFYMLLNLTSWLTRIMIICHLSWKHSCDSKFPCGQVGSRFGESTLKLGSILTDGQVGIFKDRSAAAMSTFGDILPAQAAGLLSSFTATRSDSWFHISSVLFSPLISCNTLFQWRALRNSPNIGRLWCWNLVPVTQVEWLYIWCVNNQWEDSQVKWTEGLELLK